MELKWLEDFAALASMKNFSRAAQQRHITQSAFSRRIKSLEQWLGGELVRRDDQQFALTQAGEHFRDVAIRAIREIYDARNAIREITGNGAEVVSFAALHTLALSFFPAWLESIESQTGPLRTKVIADNRTLGEYLLALQDHDCDFLLCYASPDALLWVDQETLPFLTLAEERIVPVCRPGPDGSPIYQLGRRGPEIPHMAYSPSAFLGQMLDVLLDRWRLKHRLAPVYENSMAEGLKAMLLRRDALAWLPLTLVKTELEQKRLCIVGDGEYGFDVSVRLYRSVGNKRPSVEAIWRTAASPVRRDAVNAPREGRPSRGAGRQRG